MNSNITTNDSNNSGQALETIKNFKDELSKKSLDGLTTILKKLNYLCLNFDPYNNLHLRQEEENILNEFELKEYLNNPFHFTNIILQMLDKTESEIKARKH